MMSAQGLQKVQKDCRQKVLELQAALEKAIAVEDYDRATQLHRDVTQVKSELKQEREAAAKQQAAAAAAALKLRQEQQSRLDAYVQNLQQEKQQAVAACNFQQAKLLKERIDKATAGGYTEMERQENEEHQKRREKAENEMQRRQAEAVECERQRLERQRLESLRRQDRLQEAENKRGRREMFRRGGGPRGSQTPPDSPPDSPRGSYNY